MLKVAWRKKVEELDTWLEGKWHDADNTNHVNLSLTDTVQGHLNI